MATRLLTVSTCHDQIALYISACVQYAYDWQLAAASVSCCGEISALALLPLLLLLLLLFLLLLLLSVRCCCYQYAAAASHDAAAAASMLLLSLI